MDGHAYWTSKVWPVLAGALVAVGLCGAAVTRGILMTTLTAAMFLCLIAVCTYATFSEDGLGPVRALRIGAAASLVLVVLLGLGLLHAVIGWGVAGVLALTSPPVVGRAAAWTNARRRRRRAAHLDPTHVDPQHLDDAEVARRFEAIVAQLDQDASTERDE